MMHVRLTGYPAKTITFTSPHGVVVTMPIETEGDPDGWEFDLPALASISIVGDITSVGPVDVATEGGEKVEPAATPGPRYFLRLTGGPEREVSKEEFVSAERAAGFRNTMNRPDEPATSGFGGNGIRGRIEFGPRTAAVPPEGGQHA